MKRAIAVVLALGMLAALTPAAFAGDALESIVEEGRDALLGRVTEIGEENFTVRVEYSEFGRVAVGREVTLPQVELAYEERERDRIRYKAPEAGDCVLLAVCVEGDEIALFDSSICCFTDGTDHRTVRVRTAGNKFLKRMEDHIRYGWYVTPRRAGYELAKKLIVAGAGAIAMGR